MSTITRVGLQYHVVLRYSTRHLRLHSHVIDSQVFTKLIGNYFFAHLWLLRANVWKQRYHIKFNSWTGKLFCCCQTDNCFDSLRLRNCNVSISLSLNYDYYVSLTTYLVFFETLFILIIPKYFWNSSRRWINFKGKFYIKKSTFKTN